MPAPFSADKIANCHAPHDAPYVNRTVWDASWLLAQAAAHGLKHHLALSVSIIGKQPIFGERLGNDPNVILHAFLKYERFFDDFFQNGIRGG